MQLKTYASTVWEICRNCGGATFHLPCLEVQHVIETPHPAIPLGFFFPRKYGSRLSDEHGERIPQGISQMEKRNSSKWTQSMLADYCWTLVRETSTEYC